VPAGAAKLSLTRDLTSQLMWAAMLWGENENSGAGGGWAAILNGLKTLLETGEHLPSERGPAEDAVGQARGKACESHQDPPGAPGRRH
jgi:hypothetical protein